MKSLDAWLNGKPPTVRFIILELREDGKVCARASSDERNDDGPWTTGRNSDEALTTLENVLKIKLAE